MSQENVEIARAALDALNRGDWNAAFKDAASDFELDLSRAVGPDAGVYKGGQVREWWDRLTEGWGSISFEPRDFTSVGEHVVIPLTMRGRGRDGIEVQSHPIAVYTFGNGVLTRATMYQERADALEAVGLSE